jgi:flagellar motor switch protein FliM
MHQTKTGLAALADSYGLERSELHQLRLLSERLFDQLREELSRQVHAPVRVLEVRQSAESMIEFCTDPHAQHLAILGFDGEAAVIVRLERSLALALIDAIFRAEKPARDAATHEKLTPTEEYIVTNTLGSALETALRRVFTLFFGSRMNLQLMRMEHSPQLVPDAFPPGELFATSGVRCMVGTGGGSIDVAMPLSAILQVRTRLVPVRAKISDSAAELRRTREYLAGAAMELEAVLGRKPLPLSQIQSLTVGSTILLQKVNNGVAHVELLCQGKPLFAGTIVQHRGWSRFLIQRQGENDGNG